MNCIPNSSTASVRGAVVLVGASVGHLFLPILFLLLGALSGCGSKDPFPLARVQGTVSYQGRPLELGRVVFIPVHGTPGPQAVGKIEPDGSFRMSTANREGAAIGEHVVTVHCRREPTTEESRNLVIRGACPTGWE